MSKHVLVAPLDWGLGHATRCIPIIRELLVRKCQVSLGGSGESLKLLQKEFPQLQTFMLPGYEPEYPSTGSMVWKMARQLPKFVRVISKEHAFVEQLVAENGIGLIISDNRFGCYSRKIPSVFITHQSNILMPKRFGVLAGIVNFFNEQQIGKFSHRWIPDVAGGTNLTGKLNDGVRSQEQVFFTGPLSRFSTPTTREIRFDVLAIFSGPEPQRTILENIVRPQLEKSNLRYRIIRGVIAEPRDTNDQRVSNYALTEQLQELIESSNVIIARSGFSTVMDLAVLGKKAILIPTPGQTEQEYLAQRLSEQKKIYSVSQHRFDLETALREANACSGFDSFRLDPALLKRAIEEVLQLY